MTLREMIELIHQHHPHLGEQEIRKLLNRASDDFCAKTEMVKTRFLLKHADSDSATGTSDGTIANQRFYKIPSGILKIQEVFMNDVRIPRLIGKHIIDDTTLEETTD